MASKIFNAWVEEHDTPFDPSLHARTELRVTDYDLTQEEGGIAKLTVTCENLGIGILAPGRSQYLLVSYTDDDEEDPILIFRGVANSLPTSLYGPLYDIEFLGKPDDFEELLKTFARTLNVKPYVDPLVSGFNIEDPATVLEARSEVFHIDPVTHEITLSDIIDADRLVDIGPTYVRESFDPAFVAPPLRKARKRYVAEWTQRANGTVDIADIVNEGGPKTTLTDASSIGDGGEIGQGGGSGWSIFNAQNASSTAGKTTALYWNGNYRNVLFQRTTTGPDGEELIESYIRTAYGQQPLALYSYYASTFLMQYDYSQPRREVLNVEMRADVQDIKAFGWEEEDLDDIGLQSLTEDSTTPMWSEDTDYVVGDKVIYRDRAWKCKADHTSTSRFQGLREEYEDYPSNLLKPWMYRWVQTTKDIALRDSRAMSFFETARGHEVVQHCLLEVRAFLRKRLRCFNVRFRGTWEDLWDITLRDSVRIENAFFPAGWAKGKVIAYTKHWSASDKMQRYVDVTIGVCAADGDVEVVEDTSEPYTDAIEVGYTWADAEGAVYTIDDVKYRISGEPIPAPVNPYRLGQASYACHFVRWKNLAPDQFRVANAARAGMRDSVSAVAEVPTSYELVMRSLASREIITRELTVQGSKVTAEPGIDLKFGG